VNKRNSDNSRVSKNGNEEKNRKASPFLLWVCLENQKAKKFSWILGFSENRLALFDFHVDGGLSAT
jgi:hypothetical protein